MSETIFEGPALVEMQGLRVFSFLDKNQDYARYTLIGFSNPEVLLFDYRTEGLNAIQHVLDSGDLNTFAGKFNRPAEIRVWSPEPNRLQIELKDSRSENPEHVLWVAVGMEGGLPAYDFSFCEINPLEDGKYALLSIYAQPVLEHAAA